MRRFYPVMYLIITILICSGIVITGFIQVTFIIQIILFDISMFVYYAIFVKMSNKFKCALLQKALERLCQYGSNEEELKQYKYFKYNMNIICFAFLFTSVATSILYFRLLIICILFYGNCYFPFNFLPPPQLYYTIRRSYPHHCEAICCNARSCECNLEFWFISVAISTFNPICSYLDEADFQTF